MRSCQLAELAELADALDSGSSAARLPGSSPGFRILNLDSSKTINGANQSTKPFS